MSRAWFWAVPIAASLVAGCARNPVTGERQLMLVDERGEIAMGHDADRQVTERLGLVDDPRLQAYVTTVGRRLAATAERPELPWSFRVVDDAAVNAFALPGGYVYVTRGLLAHLNSEAELAAVLGHEIGHVTARHSTSRASQARVAALSLGLGALVAPHLARNLDLAEAGVSLLMLKFGRDDEREADALGVRYLGRVGYATDGVRRVLEMLGRVELEAAPAAPGADWISTHPAADGRVDAVRPLLRAGGREDRAAYLRAIDGLVYGEDPRSGYLRGRTFVLPLLGVYLELPPGWSARNARGSLTSVSPGGDAAITVALAGAATARAGAADFAGGDGVGAQPLRRDGACWVREFTHRADDGARYHGLACFLERDARVFRLLGYARESAFAQRRAEMVQAMTSLGPAAARSRGPLRRLQVLDAGPLRLREIEAAYPSVVSARALALLNGLDPSDRLSVVPQPMKRVVAASTE